jgi:hypothetical protein
MLLIMLLVVERKLGGALYVNHQPLEIDHVVDYMVAVKVVVLPKAIPMRSPTGKQQPRLNLLEKWCER